MCFFECGFSYRVIQDTGRNTDLSYWNGGCRGRYPCRIGTTSREWMNLKTDEFLELYRWSNVIRVMNISVSMTCGGRVPRCEKLKLLTLLGGWGGCVGNWRKRASYKPRHKWENNIEMDLLHIREFRVMFWHDSGKRLAYCSARLVSLCCTQWGELVGWLRSFCLHKKDCAPNSWLVSEYRQNTILNLFLKLNIYIFPLYV